MAEVVCRSVQLGHPRSIIPKTTSICLSRWPKDRGLFPDGWRIFESIQWIGFAHSSSDRQCCSYLRLLCPVSCWTKLLRPLQLCLTRLAPPQIATSTAQGRPPSPVGLYIPEWRWTIGSNHQLPPLPSPLPIIGQCVSCIQTRNRSPPTSERQIVDTCVSHLDYGQRVKNKEIPVVFLDSLLSL